MHPRSIAVLGGGLTGLSAALNLSYRFPSSHILLFEKSKRLGGWVQTERIMLPLGSNDSELPVLLEGGPRTLRPNGAAVLELIKNLDLQNDLITVPKTSPAAKRRYIYVPPGELPGVSGLNIVGPTLSSPLMRRLFWPLLRSPIRIVLRGDVGHDESIHSFSSRLIGDDMARILGSAVTHGIYAADSRRLSAHSTLPFWTASGDKQVIADAQSTIESDVLQSHPNIGNLRAALRNVAVYSFKSGMETLTRAFEKHLDKRPNVQILRESPILSLLQKDDDFELTYLSAHKNGASLSTATADRIVSALPLPIFHDIVNQLHTDTSASHLTSLPSIPHLIANSSATVHVLNLIFRTSPSKIHPPGFGYLIPRPKVGYPSEATEAQPGILGTVFDSCSVSQQDAPEMSTDEFYKYGTHTKLTVMLGGPYPLFIPASTPSSSQFPGEALPPVIRTILNHLSIHLAKDLPDPVYWRLWRNENCIPTYSVCHRERMHEVLEILERKMPAGWGGRAEVVGAGVGGVSVSNCVLAGRNAGLKWLGN